MVLPAALLLVLGVLQFAQMFLVYRDLLAAASSAARTGTIQNSTVAEVQSALAVSLSGTAVGTNYDSQITGVGPTANGDTLVTVQVTHDFPLFFAVPGIAEENGTVPLTSSVTMRHE